MNRVTDTLQDRAGTHGEFSENARIAQEIKESFTSGVNYTENRLSNEAYEALDMIASKIARVVNGDVSCVDNWVDIAGYASLVVKKLESEKGCD